MLEVRSLSVSYGARQALDAVDLAVQPAEMVGLLGPNGAGKSTLLRVVSGTLRAASGAVLIDGVPLDEYERPALARLMAVVPGQTLVPFAMRVEELVALGRLPHEHPLLGPRVADRAAIDVAIERVGIGHLRGRDVRELSLGERQLAVVAMAVAQGARLLLLDEPTVHLDLHHQVAVMELLRDLAVRDGVTVLAVMHDVSLASHFFPRLVLLADGRVVADGTPRDVLTPERVREIYRIDPALVAVAQG
ncbi:MAG TPA: ABC transporter ATP-binding protein [Candidatus Limnocylindrales bacterium]|nr:ABC transporter ATP-binding protein [Candidatus Limnocylindrales bacterium]